MTEIKPVAALSDNYIWLVYNPRTRHCLVIDPGDAKPVIATLRALEENQGNQPFILDGILLTHHHHDHIGGVKALVQAYPAPVYGPQHDHISEVTHPLHEEDVLYFANVMPCEIKILDIPGHTLGHIAYYFLPDKHSPPRLFCGDTLFTGGCGRLFEGTSAQMFQSLSKLNALPDNTEIYCGHEYTLINLTFAKTVEPQNKAISKRIKMTQIPSVPSTLALEKNTNPFLRCHEPLVQQAVKNKFSFGADMPPAEIFKYLRLWKNNA